MTRSLGAKILIRAFALVALSLVMPLIRMSDAVAAQCTTSNGASERPPISGDGRIVGFSSVASNLIAGDTNGVADVFVRDFNSGTLTRVSVSSGGVQSNGFSGHTSMSLDGRFVVFSSDATNLVSGDTNGATDVFVRDRQLGTTERVSVTSSGAEGNGTSFNYMHAISSGGRYVVFHSDASNLVTGDTNGATDIVLHDRALSTTVRISVDSAGLQSNGPSSLATIAVLNGRYFTYQSTATNLVANDTNGVSDIFVYDQNTQLTTRVSVSSLGVQGDDASTRASISGNGDTVVYASLSSNLDPSTTFVNNLFDRDLTAGTNVQITPSWSGASILADRKPAKAAGGQHVAFKSDADNLVSGDTNAANDIFVYTALSGIIERVSVSGTGAQGNGPSDHQSISADGRFVAFSSQASNLVAGDANGFQDIFLRDRTLGTTILVTTVCSMSVPTLPQWGLLILAILLAIAGVILTRRMAPAWRAGTSSS